MSLAYQRNNQRHCSRCHAQLDDPASEERGIGPICAKKDTVLFARGIPANFAGATALLMGMHQEALPETIWTRFEALRENVLHRASRAARRNDDFSVIQLTGEDLRPVIKEIDWFLSHNMAEQVRRFFVRIVKYLGYVELAAVLSQEASTTPAKVWFEQSDGKVYLTGKSCKAGFMTMRRIPGISFPRYRGSAIPYTAPAKEVEKFLAAVQDFWPMYEGDLTKIAQEAQEWQQAHSVTIAPAIVLAPPTAPVASLKMLSLEGRDQGTWIELSFPWLQGRNTEMYALIAAIKTIPYTDRKYNPVSKRWLVRMSHREKVTKAMSNLFQVEVLS